MRSKLLLAGVPLFDLNCAAFVHVQSTTETDVSYALGRLIEVETDNAENDGETREIEYYDVGSRVSYEAAGWVPPPPSPPSGCVIEAVDASARGESNAYPFVRRVGSCGQGSTLSYTVQRVSGPGSYPDRGFRWSDSVIAASGTSYLDAQVAATLSGCDEYCSHEGQRWILRVISTFTSGNATFSNGNTSTVTFKDTW